MKKIYVFLFLVMGVFTGYGQVNITSLGALYNQNFDSLTNTGTAGSYLPVGWVLSESGTNANSTYAADNGGMNGGNTYSYGATNATDRAFGGLQSGSLVPTIGAAFTNNSGSTITSITVSYFGERWRLGALSRVDSLIFQYAVGTSSLTAGTYTTVSQLSYGVAAAASPAVVGALDGNAAANRTSITYTITGLSIPNGTSFSFRWNDYNASGADDGLAIDDVTITFNGATLPPCTTPTAQPTSIAFSSVSTTSFNVSFSAASPVPDEYLALISTSATLSTTPVNGTVYNTDDVIGNAIVAYRGSATTFSETNLTPGTTYYIYIFALNSNCNNGPIYFTISPATASQATTTPAPCTAPATQPTNIVATTVTGNSISGSFTAVPTADSYLITVGTNITIGFTPTNGTTYTVGSIVGNNHRIIKAGPGNTFTATGLTPNTNYYIYIIGYNATGCTGGPVYFTNYTSNPAGIPVQTNNNTSGIPAGYYDTITTQTCAPLKSALKWRTTSGHTPKTYGDLWTQYLVSDVKPREVGPGTSASVIWDIYSDNPTGTDPYNFTPGPVASGGQQDNGTTISTEGLYYNREHSVPLSWFNGNTSNNGPATDYLHIYPTDKWVNAQRGNYIYGEVSSPTYTSQNGGKLGPNGFAGLTGTAFEPINEYKGDVARSFLYFVTRYEDNMPSTPGGSEGGQAFEPNTYPSVDTPYLRLMIKWHNQDPVSQKEIDRNNAAYTFQGNRNPYIDHPEYVALVWSNNCLGALPVQIVSFTGSLRANSVVLNWEVHNETDLQQYIIERSDNGTRYTTVGSIAATNRKNYQFTDDISNLTGRRLYYRLKKVDKDGKYTYSQVFTVHVPLKLTFSVYPNPAVNGKLQLQLAKPATANTYLQLLDASGKIYKKMAVSTGAVNITVQEKLIPGMYLLQLVQPGGEVEMQKVLIQ